MTAMAMMPNYHAISLHANLCGSWETLGEVWSDLKADEEWADYLAGVMEVDDVGNIVRAWSS